MVSDELSISVSKIFGLDGRREVQTRGFTEPSGQLVEGAVHRSGGQTDIGSKFGDDGSRQSVEFALRTIDRERRQLVILRVDQRADEVICRA